jgi:hypothetical protein
MTSVEAGGAPTPLRCAHLCLGEERALRLSDCSRRRADRWQAAAERGLVLEAEPWRTGAQARDLAHAALGNRPSLYFGKG